MVQKNRKMELRSTNQIKKLKEKVEVKRFKKYTQVHLVKATYTHWSTEQKDCIRIHTLPQEEKRVHVGKPRFSSELSGPRYFGPRYLL